MDRSPCPDTSRPRGFTLLELVAVIAIVSILSVVATSMFSRLAFETAAFGRELESVLAYAQKAAVAERRTVSVAVAANSVTFTICPTFNPCGVPAALSLPTRDGGSVLAAPAGVTIAPAGTFAFTPSGGTDLGGALTLTVTGDGARSVVIEAATGYVHPL